FRSVDIESVSGNERRIADRVEEVLRGAPHLRVDRLGHTLMARTELGRGRRVILAGHLDTVPVAGNLPARVDGEAIHGCGTSDMKSGVALALHLAAAVAAPRCDVTYLFYEADEVESERNGLHLVSRAHPEWLAGDLAVLLEPTYGVIEAGCQGTLRVTVRTTGVRAHSARSWRGVNAIHAAGEVLDRLREYQPRRVVIDGCQYREGLNAVGIRGGGGGDRPCTRGVRRPRGVGRRRGRRCPARSNLATGRRTARRGRRAARGETGVDGRGPVRRAGRTGAELRSG